MKTITERFHVEDLVPILEGTGWKLEAPLEIGQTDIYEVQKALIDWLNRILIEPRCHAECGDDPEHLNVTLPRRITPGFVSDFQPTAQTEYAFNLLERTFPSSQNPDERAFTRTFDFEAWGNDRTQRQINLVVKGDGEVQISGKPRAFFEDRRLDVAGEPNIRIPSFDRQLEALRENRPSAHDDWFFNLLEGLYYRLNISSQIIRKGRSRTRVLALKAVDTNTRDALLDRVNAT